MVGSHHAVEEASVDKGAEGNGLGFLADKSTIKAFPSCASKLGTTSGALSV